MSFSEELRKIRESKGMTVNQLAIYSGISAASISRYETGERGTPKPPTIEKLAKGLKVDYKVLMQAAGYISDTKYNSESKKGEVLKEMAEKYNLDVNNQEHFEILDRAFKFASELLNNKKS